MDAGGRTTQETKSSATAMDGGSAGFAGAKTCLLSHGGEAGNNEAKLCPAERLARMRGWTVLQGRKQ
jgi:hypothetical protein